MGKLKFQDFTEKKGGISMNITCLQTAYCLRISLKLNTAATT